MPGGSISVERRLGLSDPSMADLERISLEILGGEFFVVLSEFDAFWGMPPGMSTSMPGLDYVLTNCSSIAISGFIFRARNSVSSVAGQSKDGVAYIELPRKEFFAKVGYDPKAKAFIKQKPKAEETPKERADDEISMRSSRSLRRNRHTQLRLRKLDKQQGQRAIDIAWISSTGTGSANKCGDQTQEEDQRSVP